MINARKIISEDVVPTERVTVTLPSELLRRIDRMEKNRSAFILEAARRELERRRRAELRRSMRSPHPETEELAQAGFDDWARSLPHEDIDELVNVRAGTGVKWLPGRGWMKAGK
jgi:hypothetical protein